MPRPLHATALSLEYKARHLLGFRSAKSCRTPGITRRPARLLEFENVRVGGRVHAVVRWRAWQRHYSKIIFVSSIISKHCNNYFPDSLNMANMMIRTTMLTIAIIKSARQVTIMVVSYTLEICHASGICSLTLTPFSASVA